MKRSVLYSLLFMTGSSMSVSTHAATISNLQIDALISEAIQTHPLVGSARADRVATTEGISAAKLGLLPVPSVSTGYDPDNDVISRVSIRQPLWTGGRLTANVNQAVFDDKAAVEHIYEQQNQVAKTTIEAWQSYITAVAEQRVYSENLKKLADFEAMMGRRVKQGVSARIELDLVTNRILQEQNAYQAALEQQRIAAARLEQITGNAISIGSANSVPLLKVLVDQAKIQSASFEQLAFSDASFYNPAVVREQFQVESAKQEVKAQRAALYPSVFAEYEHVYYHKDNENDGKLFVGLNYEPGAGFSNLALTRASQARVNSLEQTQEAARRSVMEDIQVQYQQFVSAKSRELSLVAAVAGAQIVVNSYRRQFIAGRKSWLEVLNAVRELSEYEIQLVQTRANILGNFYKLQVDFGLMDWQGFNHTRTPVKIFSVTDPVKDWMHKQQQDLNNTQLSVDSRKLDYDLPNASSNRGLDINSFKYDGPIVNNNNYGGTYPEAVDLESVDSFEDIINTDDSINNDKSDRANAERVNNSAAINEVENYTVEVRLPESLKQRLENGEILQVSEDQINRNYFDEVTISDVAPSVSQTTQLMPVESFKVPVIVNEKSNDNIEGTDSLILKAPSIVNPVTEPQIAIAQPIEQQRVEISTPISAEINEDNHDVTAITLTDIDSVTLADRDFVQLKDDLVTIGTTPFTTETAANLEQQVVIPAVFDQSIPANFNHNINNENVLIGDNLESAYQAETMSIIDDAVVTENANLKANVDNINGVSTDTIPAITINKMPIVEKVAIVPKVTSTVLSPEVNDTDDVNDVIEAYNAVPMDQSEKVITSSSSFIATPVLAEAAYPTAVQPILRPVVVNPVIVDLPEANNLFVSEDVDVMTDVVVEKILDTSMDSLFVVNEQLLTQNIELDANDVNSGVSSVEAVFYGTQVPTQPLIENAAIPQITVDNELTDSLLKTNEAIAIATNDVASATSNETIEAVFYGMDLPAQAITEQTYTENDTARERAVNVAGQGERADAPKGANEAISSHNVMSDSNDEAVFVEATFYGIDTPAQPAIEVVRIENIKSEQRRPILAVVAADARADSVLVEDETVQTNDVALDMSDEAIMAVVPVADSPKLNQQNANTVYIDDAIVQPDMDTMGSINTDGRAMSVSLDRINLADALSDTLAVGIHLDKSIRQQPRTLSSSNNIDSDAVDIDLDTVNDTKVDNYSETEDLLIDSTDDLVQTTESFIDSTHIIDNQVSRTILGIREVPNEYIYEAYDIKDLNAISALEENHETAVFEADVSTVSEIKPVEAVPITKQSLFTGSLPNETDVEAQSFKAPIINVPSTPTSVESESLFTPVNPLSTLSEIDEIDSLNTGSLELESNGNNVIEQLLNNAHQSEYLNTPFIVGVTIDGQPMVSQMNNLVRGQ